MAPISERKMRFSEVVFAINTSPKALRNWLQREQVQLVSERPEGAWQHFTIADIAALALVRAIVDFGVGVETASRLARSILLEIQGKNWFKLERDLTDVAPSVSMFWTNRAILIFPDDRREHWTIKVWDMWKRFPHEVPAAVIVIKPEEILRSAIERAIDGADWTDESTPDFVSERILSPISDAPVPETKSDQQAETQG